MYHNPLSQNMLYVATGQIQLHLFLTVHNTNLPTNTHYSHKAVSMGLPWSGCHF